MKRFFLPFLAISLATCGTNAGNPKRPTPRTPPQVGPDPKIVDEKPAGEIFLLPTIEFDLVDETFATPMSFALLEDPVVTPTKVFNTQGQRLQRLIKELNLTAQRINEILKTKVTVKPDSVEFKNKGTNGTLSGQVVRKTNGQNEFEAVICTRGEPTQFIIWSKTTSTIELWRDFSREYVKDQDLIGLVSHVVFSTNGYGGLKLEIASQGIWNDDESDAEFGLLEKVISNSVPKDQMFTLKSVQDRFKGGAPSSPEGDIYLTGKLYSRTDGKPGFDQEFVGFSKFATNPACQRGFDENSPSLWNPKGSDKRFCVGRNRGGAPFGSFPPFVSLVNTMESIGIVKVGELKRVDMPKGLTCPPP
jgi:hypothetical protein